MWWEKQRAAGKIFRGWASDGIPVTASAACPDVSCLCPRELAECRKTQQEESVDESRSRVQLAGIEAKHVSGRAGTEQAGGIPGSPRCCSLHPWLNASCC